MTDIKQKGLAYPDLQDGHEVYEALLNHGMFVKPHLPPCFTSEGLSEKIKEIKSQYGSFEGEKLPKDYIRYSAYGHELKSRDFGVPHPIAYHRLCSVIKTHWGLINKASYVESKKNFCHVRKAEGRDSIFQMDPERKDKYAIEDSIIRYRFGAQYKVKADISKCFPSVYTHAITWGIATKEVAKMHFAEEHGCKKECECEECLTYKAGKGLDKAVRYTANGETHGLLIGPHASNILSEIILCRVDRELSESDNKGRYVRHIDDYAFYASSGKEAKKFVRDLSLSLGKYGLKLNESKKSITKLPETEIDWPEKLNQFNFPPSHKQEEEEFTGEFELDALPAAPSRLVGFTSIRAYLKLAMALTNSYGSTAPLKYAVKVLASEGKGDSVYHTNLNLSPRGALNAAFSILELCLSYPYLCPYVEPAIDAFRKLVHGHTKKMSELDEAWCMFVRRLISVSVENLYTDAIAYGFYFATKYGIKINATLIDIDEILRLDDCFVLTLMREYAINNDDVEGMSEWEDAIIKHAEDKNKDNMERDKFWLLIYQCLNAEDIEDPWLQALSIGDFDFINWNNPVPPFPESFY